MFSLRQNKGLSLFVKLLPLVLFILFSTQLTSCIKSAEKPALQLTLTLIPTDIPTFSPTEMEFELNLQKWRDAKITHYRFQLINNYQGSYDRDTPVIIEVKDGKPTSIESLSVKKIDNTYLLLINRYATIDLIFETLRFNFATADEVNVSYDLTYGYPIDIYTDIDGEALDDEEMWSITEFEVLP